MNDILIFPKELNNIHEFLQHLIPLLSDKRKLFQAFNQKLIKILNDRSFLTDQRFHTLQPFHQYIGMFFLHKIIQYRCYLNCSVVLIINHKLISNRLDLSQVVMNLLIGPFLHGPFRMLNSNHQWLEVLFILLHLNIITLNLKFKTKYNGTNSTG